MKRPILKTTLILAPLLLLGGGALQPAQAGDWYIGGGFRVGDFLFSLAYDRGHRHSDPYYYRTRDRISYRGYSCGSYCLKKSGYAYHHAGCPVVRHHFRLHGFHPASVWDHYRGPVYDRHHDRGRHYGHRDYGRRGRGHRDYGRYDHRHRDYYSRYHRDHDRRYCPYR